MIGYPLSHSFSPRYFAEKFAAEQITDAVYDAIPLSSIKEVADLISSGISGFNVTIPYKEAILPYLDHISPEAKMIGAVNCVDVVDGKSYGYNTDVVGIYRTLVNWLAGNRPDALILGTGGAAKAVSYVLDQMDISYRFVSRRSNYLQYQDLNADIITQHHLIINTTPLGMSPNVDQSPDIPYEYIGQFHFVFDLIYNPEKTLFLSRAEDRGAKIINGSQMLYDQADESWRIWNQEKQHDLMAEPEPRSPINFTNTEIAFANKSDKELRKTHRLFRLMSSNVLTKLMSSLGLVAVKYNIPLARYIVKQTIYSQFCGGETLLDCQGAIDKLNQHNALTILDYGAEGKSGEDELDAVMLQTISAIELAASNNSVPVVSCKITGLADNELLVKLQTDEHLTKSDQYHYDKLISRLDQISSTAHELGVGVFIDAEESWMQITIDRLTTMMMEKYNHDQVIIYNTYQLYRHDKLEQLKQDYKIAKEKGYFLGAKLVRGAYMEKERNRAEEMGYPSPIHKDKAAVDRDFDEAVRFCVEHYEDIGSCCASHNEKSNLYQAERIERLGIDKSHRHLNFCQLYGMSDHITFNLAEAGYNVAKYVVYGPVKEVIPYLIRRAQENTSVTGEMGRELMLIDKEVKRRGI